MFSSRATINLGSRSVSILEKEKEIWSRGWQGVERRIYIYIVQRREGGNLDNGLPGSVFIGRIVERATSFPDM